MTTLRQSIPKFFTSKYPAPWYSCAYWNLRSICPANVRRILRYIPTLWNDVDFQIDDGIWRLLRIKIELVERSLSSRLLYEGVEGDCADMRRCMSPLDRLIADEYEDGAMELRGNAEFRAFMDEAEEAKDEDVRELFRIISTRYGFWWD